jgi:hypothetical protein
MPPPPVSLGALAAGEPRGGYGALGILHQVRRDRHAPTLTHPTHPHPPSPNLTYPHPTSPTLTHTTPTHSHAPTHVPNHALTHATPSLTPSPTPSPLALASQPTPCPLTLTQASAATAAALCGGCAGRSLPCATRSACTRRRRCGVAASAPWRMTSVTPSLRCGGGMDTFSTYP